MSNLKSIAEKWIAGEIDAGEYIACLVNRIDTLEGLEIPAAHRAGWEQCKQQIIAEWEKPYGLTDGTQFIARLRGMEYKEPTND